MNGGRGSPREYASDTVKEPLLYRTSLGEPEPSDQSSCFMPAASGMLFALGIGKYRLITY